MNRWRREWLAGNPAVRAQARRLGLSGWWLNAGGQFEQGAPHLPPWVPVRTTRAHAVHYLDEAGRWRLRLAFDHARSCIATARLFRQSRAIGPVFLARTPPQLPA